MMLYRIVTLNEILSSIANLQNVACKKQTLFILRCIKIRAHVGKFISTKKVGSNGRDDLTLEYKHSEGSIEERIAFKSIGHGIGGAPAPG